MEEQTLLPGPGLPRAAPPTVLMVWVAHRDLGRSIR
jgi:hypothetical protein